METLEKQLETYILESQDSFYRLAFSYVRDADAAMDVVQNAIVQALTHLHTLREPAYIRTWFYRILVNEGLQYIRQNKRLFPCDELPEEIMAEEDVAGRLDLYRAVFRLKPKLRTVIVLRFYEDMALKDIARVTRTNLSTVKSRLYKALAELKLLYDEESV